MKLPANAHFLLFDMDGTLVDTEPVGPQTFIAQLARYGVQPTEEEQALFLKIWRRDGTDIKQDDWLPEIARRYSLKHTAESYLEEFYHLYKEAIAATPALPGATEFLQKAKATGAYQIALVTASKRKQAETILARHDWQELFDVLITAENFTKHKPDPEPYIAAIHKLGADPRQCTVFEDSKNGTQAAAAAGCYVVGLRAGNSTPQDLSAANEIVTTFNDLDLA